VIICVADDHGSFGLNRLYKLATVQADNLRRFLENVHTLMVRLF